MNSKPSISVVVATYNGANYIDQQIKSILQQLGVNDELVVSDDHSTDDTVHQLKAIQDARIKIISPATSLGPIANFEFGLKHSQNAVVALSDQDDIWLPGRVEAIRDHFANSNTPYDLLVMNSRVVNERLEIISPSVFRLINCGPGLLKNIYRNTYIGCHMAFKRSLLNAAIPFPVGIPMHDVWLGLVSELMGAVTFLEEPTMLFRRTGKNFTKARYGWGKRITWRFNLIRVLLFFILFRRGKSNLSLVKK